MAIAFGASAGSTGTGTNAIGPHTITKPTLSDGSVVILGVSWNAAVHMTVAPVGFFELGPLQQDGATGNLQLFWRYVATAAGEPAWDCTFSAACRIATVAAAYTGVHARFPVDVWGFLAESATDTTRDTPTVTTTDAGDWVVAGCFDRFSSAGTVVTHTEGTLTERVDGDVPTNPAASIATSTNGMHMCLYDSNATVAVAAYSKTITSSVSTAIAGAFILGLRADTVAAPNGTQSSSDALRSMRARF